MEAKLEAKKDGQACRASAEADAGAGSPASHAAAVSAEPDGVAASVESACVQADVLPSSGQLLSNPSRPQTRSMPLRIFVYLCGVLVCGIGVVLSARSNFGAPAFQAVPLVFSEGTHLLTLGQSCMCLYTIDVIIQIIVFRKISAKVLLQLPFALLFGSLIDLLDAVLALDAFWFCHDPNLLVSCIMFAIGIVAIAIGVSAMVAMDFVLNPADGCTQALMRLTGLPFGKAKIINDVFRFALACAMAWLLCGYLFGVGVGTVISMFAIGAICQVVSGWAVPLYEKAYIPAKG